MDWIPSIEERRLYSFVHATNAELESLLGSVDEQTRRKTRQRTVLTGAVAVARRNSVSLIDRYKEDPELGHKVIDAMIAGRDKMAQWDRERQALVREHRARVLDTLRKKREDARRRAALYAEKLVAIEIVTDDGSSAGV